MRLIDADHLKNKLGVWWDKQDEIFAEMIDECPTINPQEPKTGHWKRISIDKYSEHAKYWYRCDRCGNDNLGNTDWCPNCGARMFEPQESDNCNQFSQG